MNKPGTHRAATRSDDGPSGPPFPKWMYAVINPLVTAVLGSPLHRLVSNNLLLLSYTGRRSGRRFTLPVGYLERGAELFVFTHGAWALNLQHAAPVSVRLRGALRRGAASHVDESGARAELQTLFMEQRGMEMARRVGLLAADAAAQPAYIKIQLED